MGYKVVVTDEGGEEVHVEAHAVALEVEQGDEGLWAKVAWEKDELKEDPAGFLAVTGAWPGVGSLSLWEKDAEEALFTGQISGVGYCGEKIFLKASGDGGEEPPAELSVEVSADEADPNRLSALIVADNGDEGEVAVDFGDGSAAGTNPGDGTTTTAHVYAAAGTYKVTVTDADDASRTASADVVVPFPAA